VANSTIRIVKDLQALLLSPSAPVVRVLPDDRKLEPWDAFAVPPNTLVANLKQRLDSASRIPCTITIGDDTFAGCDVVEAHSIPSRSEESPTTWQTVLSVSVPTPLGPRYEEAVSGASGRKAGTPLNQWVQRHERGLRIAKWALAGLATYFGWGQIWARISSANIGEVFGWIRAWGWLPAVAAIAAVFLVPFALGLGIWTKRIFLQPAPVGVWQQALLAFHQLLALLLITLGIVVAVAILVSVVLTISTGGALSLSLRDSLWGVK
jgi:hypothetical protein